MYFKLHWLVHFLVGTALGLACLLGAHAEAADSATTATVHGHVSDPSGARIAKAQITIATASGTAAKTVASDDTGAYEARGLTPGNYVVIVDSPGFAEFQSQALELTPGEVKRVDVTMAIEVAQQSVEVSDDTPQVSVDAGSNANSIVIKGSDLDALSDDPDELANELSALAGPSAGPNGGQIYIDGFTGGQLPPKSAIREIRINQNPFSAEFDRLGYGRIEILTKPGTNQLHGRVFLQGNQSSLNTGNPFTPSVPPYYMLQYNGTVTGSLGKKTSFEMSVEQRNNHDENVYTYTPAVLDTTSGQYTLSPTQFSDTLSNPHDRIEIAPRIDVQLGQKDTLTLRYQFFRNAESGDIGSNDLPSQSQDTHFIEHTIQASDAHIVNDHMVNETRFEYRRSSDSAAPVSTAPTLVVSGNFTGGGASGQSSSQHDEHFELQNITTMSKGSHAIKFGTRLRDNRIASSSFSNRNGTLVFSEQGYVDALNALAAGDSLSTLPQGDFTQLRISAGRTDFNANVFDAALFIEDDWRVSPRFTLSGGLRWESQNHISDRSDWAPRVALAYALDAKGNKPAKTVLRAGYGIFYDRFDVDSVLSAAENGIDSGQAQVTLLSPACLSGTDLNSMDFTACLPSQPYAATPQTTTVQISPDFHSPYVNQFGASIERQATKSITATVTYLRSLGVHQMVTRDANAYLPGTFEYGSTTLTGARPDAALGVINEFYPEAVFKQNQMIVNVNARLGPKFSMFGFYNFSDANSNGAGGTASNSYNLNQDYGRAGFVSRHMVFMMGNYVGPWGIRVNPFVIAHTGRPYNVVSSLDLTGDQYLNNRPSIVASSLCTAGSTQYYQTKFGCLNTIPQPGEDLIPINAGDSPASAAVNLRLSRDFGIGPKVESGGGGDFGGPRGHWRGRGPGGGFGPGGFGGNGGRPGMAGSQGAARKYSLSFSVQALNVLNIINYGTPLGTVGTSRFGESTSLQRGPFSSGAAARRIFMQAVFSF
ncbi:MAG TPA: carboxypeptidase regulatory-like domain-containing protein [Terracidiphilus sp.]|nr:carboxypeptidase regulatory-like domain-containing protein [Terracidiphilus sp.]